MNRIDLVFRSNRERTARAAWELALRHIQPDHTRRIEGITPFVKAVETTLNYEYPGDYVVIVDADCLILEDLRPFLDFNEAPFVDCYVIDRFRGRTQAGVHILRRDVLDAMKQQDREPARAEFVLRPESYLRNRAMERMGVQKRTKGFFILHDHFQSYHDIFAKIVVRDLRYRAANNLDQFEQLSRNWSDDPDFVVARSARSYVAERMRAGLSVSELSQLISDLPTAARREVGRLALPRQMPLESSEIQRTAKRRHAPGEAGRAAKIIGIGLAGTGQRSLHKALCQLGYDILYDPLDTKIRADLADSTGNLRLLDHYDGVTGEIGAAFYRELDGARPGCQFILTIRDDPSWLESLRGEWNANPASDAPGDPCPAELEFLRNRHARLYGQPAATESQLLAAYRKHVTTVLAYFRDRREDLLVLDLDRGQGWEALCHFLSQPQPDRPFPHRLRRENKPTGAPPARPSESPSRVPNPWRRLWAATRQLAGRAASRTDAGSKDRSREDT